ncbi:agglutinin-like [Solanum dulcamara]|uniref:agglutinin-like n=1 Tax=Solanum dulcamara TaxID=45834 RepID=UPI0024866A91|nr:agglutinin-like [Solanum dulcamara]
MLVESWGGTSGSEWNYKFTNPIKEIVIAHETVIDSIIFRTLGQQGIIDSPKFGGRGGNKKFKVTIENAPWEYLTGIRGTLGYYVGHLVVKSLCFTTNLKTYGTIGAAAGGTPFSLVLKEGGAIVGFHGRYGAYLDAIGVYLQHVAAPEHSKPLKDSKVEEISDKFPNVRTCTCSTIVKVHKKLDVMKCIQPRSPGPWGGCSGKGWDDGVFCTIKQVHIYMNTIISAVSGIQIEYEKKDKTSVWSQLHGGFGIGAGNYDNINIDGENEILIGIEGYYSPVKENGGLDTLRQITFYTNKGKYGPYGTEIGAYFRSSAARGKIVGFHGKCGVFLNAVGVHMEYF